MGLLTALWCYWLDGMLIVAIFVIWLIFVHATVNVASRAYVRGLWRARKNVAEQIKKGTF